MPTRREFLLTTGPAALTLASLQPRLFAAEKTRQLTIGYIGCGGRSHSLSDGFRGHADVVWACDPDESHASELQKRTEAKRTTTDFRKVLEDESVDAVVIATPDHWHAPAAIMACHAGKHVYVEKPCSHNIVEGKQLVQAARRNKVIVQHGTQSRSNPLILSGIQLLKDGIIGEVLMAKAWNVQRRANIGHSEPSKPPSGLDYETWIGPAEFVPFQSNRFHYTWHWWRNFGTGDAGNDGVHELDYARWGLGVEGMPTQVSGMGGKYYFDDDQEFPDSIYCSYDWPGPIGKRRQLIFEMRIWSRPSPHNCDNGVEFYGTKGLMVLSKRGVLEIYDERNNRIETPQIKVDAPVNHQVNFLECIQTGNTPTADIAIGHDSAALAHLANITARLGRTLHLDQQGEVKGDSEANAMFGRTYRNGHWAIPKENG